MNALSFHENASALIVSLLRAERGWVQSGVRVQTESVGDGSVYTRRRCLLPGFV